VCTNKGRARLLGGLSDVRTHYGLSEEIVSDHGMRPPEMKWEKISRYYLDAYRAWVDIFFEDPFARFSLFRIDSSSKEWTSFRPRPGRRRYQDDRLASAYHQFLLVTFGRLSDTKRWSVYPDAGLFSRDTVLDRVEFPFNRTYKLALGPKSSRIIRGAQARDSSVTDLVQLADVLLGAFSLHVVGDRPESPAKSQFVDHCATTLTTRPNTQRGLPRLSVESWVPPEHFSYR
jgi:hypothetical protein